VSDEIDPNWPPPTPAETPQPPQAAPPEQPQLQEPTPDVSSRSSSTTLLAWKRPRVIVAVLVAVVLIAALATVAFVMTRSEGHEATIKPEGAAGSVTDLVSKQTGFKPYDVKCPSGVAAEVGKEFECHFTGPDGKDYTAQMKITKVEGDDVQFHIKTQPS
jgi:Domain of unknown function (DUF4333)